MATTDAPVPLRIPYTVDRFLEAYVEDPSLGGIVVVANVSVPAGTKIDLTIEFAPAQLLRVIAEVQSVRTNASGQVDGLRLRFLKMDATQAQWLERKGKEFLERRRAAAAPVKAGHELRKAASGEALAGAVDRIDDYHSGDEPVLGIDLGTCNSAACYVKDGQPVIIDLSDESEREVGVRSLPSVVAYDDNGRELVGAAAKEGLATNPRRTIFGAKRFIGRTYDSPAVQSLLSRFPYRVVSGPEGRVAVDINNRALALTSISGKILAAIRTKAQQKTGVSFQRAVITVPAFYNGNQREAVVQAGRMAGFTVDRIINEPTAAALAYGLTRSQPRRLLVYDLGGGTFDVSVMSVGKNALQVLATAGDTFLGGEDFDDVIVKYVAEQFTLKTKKQLSQNHAAMAVIKDAAEKAKRRLSSRDKTMVTLREVLLLDRSMARLEIELSRETIEKLVAPLVSRTLKICDMALREAKMEVDQLADVILVGGQTRMPYVQAQVREHFKRAPRSDLNPDEVVAMGAGMLAAIAGEGPQLEDVLSMSIGIGIGSKFKPLIVRNTPVPAKKSVTIAVPRDRFENYAIDVWQGDMPELHSNEHLGALRANTVGPGSKDPVGLRIDFIVNKECLLKVRLTNLETGEEQGVLLATRDKSPTT